MLPVARAERVIDMPVARVFAALADFTTWQSWMPRSFRPARGPQRKLEPGDRIVALLGGVLPTTLRVVRVTTDREVTWGGGIPGLIAGEHAFYLEDLGASRTRVRSEEPFTGLIAQLPFIGRAIERGGSAAAEQMIDGLQRFVSGS